MRWRDKIAAGEQDVADLLADCPDQMCPYIDRVMPERGGRRGWKNAMRFPEDYSSVEAAVEVAAEIENERDALASQIEDCRAGLNNLREALVATVEQYRVQRDEAARLRDLIALHGPVGAGNEVDTLVEMKRLAFLDGLEAAAELCERRGSPPAGCHHSREEMVWQSAASAIRDIESKP